MLANGSGKARASREASLRKAPKWRLLFLSSGELSLADKVGEDIRGRRVTAGQQVRVVDVPADTRAHGLFENIHGFEAPGALAKHLVAAANAYYGTAARAFIEQVSQELEKVREIVRLGVLAFVDEICPDGADGQVRRVAGRFGLIAIAGEVAIDFGILPWPAGEARQAAKTCFKAWLEARGGPEAAEVRDGIAQVRAFISAHGLSRFLPAWNEDEDETGSLHGAYGQSIEPRRPNEDKFFNLAGFRRQVEGSWEFYVTTEAWPEVCTGFDAKALAGHLAKRDYLVVSDKGAHRARAVRIPGHGQRRVYHLPASFLADAEASDG